MYRRSYLIWSPVVVAVVDVWLVCVPPVRLTCLPVLFVDVLPPYEQGDTLRGAIGAAGEGGRSAGGVRGHDVLLPCHHRHTTKRERGSNREPALSGRS